MCRSGCPTQDHTSWGECARAANLRILWAASASGMDRTREKKWDKNLADYKALRAEGIQPRGTSPAAVREAKEVSDLTGKPVDFSRSDLGIA